MKGIETSKTTYSRKEEKKMRKTMKLGFLALMVAALAFTLGNSAMAFHDAAGLICMKCHTMHANEGGTTPTMPDETGGTAEGPNAHLLYKSNVTDLCLVCHQENNGYTGAPKVYSASGTQAIGVPGGDYYSSGDSTNGDAGKGHNPAYSVQADGTLAANSSLIKEDSTLGRNPPDGGAAGDDLPRWDCVACHAPHEGDSSSTYGTAATFRMLWTKPAGQAKIVAAGIELIANTSETTPQDLLSNESGTNHTAYEQNVSKWCGQCHGNFHNTAKTSFGSDSYWTRHPTGVTLPDTYVTNYGSPATYDPIVPVEDTAATTGDFTVTTSSKVMCLTCHRAHAAATAASTPGGDNGKNNKNMTRWDMTKASGSGTGCNKCHAKG